MLSDAERATLGEIGHRFGRTALADVANAAKPDTSFFLSIHSQSFTALRRMARFTSNMRLIVAFETPTPDARFPHAGGFDQTSRENLLESVLAEVFDECAQSIFCQTRHDRADRAVDAEFAVSHRKQLPILDSSLRAPSPRVHCTPALGAGRRPKRRWLSANVTNLAVHRETGSVGTLSRSARSDTKVRVVEEMI